MGFATLFLALLVRLVFIDFLVFPSSTMASTDGVLQVLRAALPTGSVHLKGSAAYEALNGGYLSGLESDLQPLLIFQPSSVAEVVTFVRTINPSSGLIHCAIRGAGQQPLPGCANVNNGITLDLSQLSSITLTKDHSVVQLGAGVRWGAVYQKLDPLGLSVAGSRSGMGGVGGLALAGSSLCCLPNSDSPSTTTGVKTFFRRPLLLL